MKKVLGISLIALCAVLLTAGPRKMPPTVGKKGPLIAVFSGGRPWRGADMCNMLVKAGCRGINANGAYLDGFNGATIKVNMTDKVEPTPFDGITPLLEKLTGKKLVVFHDIPANLMAKMLTSERIAQLKSYVENGGNILFTLDCPNEVGDLLPLQMEEMEAPEAPLFANRPAGEKYAAFPEKIPVYRAFHRGRAVEGATVLSMIRDENGNEVAPFLVRKSVGKGTVTFLNAEIAYALQLKEFSNWAYGKAFFIAVVGDSANVKVKADALIERMQPIPERKNLDEIAVSVQIPQLGVTECAEVPEIKDKTVTFANGCCLTLAENGSVEITYPGQTESLIRNYRIPEISYSTDRSLFDEATAEATDAASETTPADIKWQFAGISVDGKSAVISYTAKDSLMRWIFTAGKLLLDGREYAGVADRIEVTKCPLYINKVVFTSDLTPEKPLFSRRNSCYSPPRGYAEFDMTGKTTADTSFWSYFGSGQPFELVACENGVFLGNIDEAESVEVRLARQKGEKAITRTRRHGFGRVLAPVASKNYWHWYSVGAERGHNEYLAMYQLQRQTLRRKAGLDELPIYPGCRVSHQVSEDEQKAVRDAAAKAGFRFLRLPGAEEPADVSYRASRFPLIRELRDKGVRSHIWTAGSYVQGDGGWIYNHHPEWFVRDPKGKIFAYSGSRYPVIDVNNEEYYKWFCELAKPAIEAGVGLVYRDMDGAAANCVNYAKKQSPHGLASQIRFYRFFHQNNCHVAIEGMNPLVLDEYWYRPHLYTPFAGNEFALVGSVPTANFYEGLELDFFRAGMFGCFLTSELSGYTFQFDRVADEVVRANRMVSLVPKFNETLDHVGMPFIRETSFGTTWISDKGGALLFWNPAKKVTVDLPQGWKIRGVEGNVLADVKGDSIYLLEKK
ncbi:MAG: hypothetical protein MJ033_06670 [Victivallaceae bacterium]|nr:hypothetical protein [Victivallaceae bacterium]